MTTPKITPLYDILDFNGPLSNARADRLIASLGLLDGARVVDIGCGWGEFLLRVAASGPIASAVGVDRSTRDIDHARKLAADRDLTDTVRFECVDVAEWQPSEDADIVINVGSSHVWGGEPVTHTGNALSAARSLLDRGGRLVFGECFWEKPPSPEQLAIMENIPREQYGTFGDLVDVAVQHGFAVVDVAQASLDEWDAFESGHGVGQTMWLVANADSPEASDVRERAASHRRRWLHGWRGVQGFAYLSLVAV